MNLTVCWSSFRLKLCKSQRTQGPWLAVAGGGILRPPEREGFSDPKTRFEESLACHASDMVGRFGPTAVLQILNTKVQH